MNLVAILGLLLATSHACLAENTYSAYLPKYIRPGVPYVIDVEVMNIDAQVDITATLASKDFESEKTVPVSGKVARIEFDSIPYDYSGATKFNVTVTGINSVTGEEIFKNETTAIDYQKKFLSIFIQTDKAIYQPGHTIKFRAVVTTPELLPYQGSVTYKLLDPSGNTILMESDVPLVNGVVGSQFKLGRYSTQGDWRIVYQVHGYEESITVSVEEYKLPKFSVEIKTDQAFLHPGSQGLTGEISAQFTFGQPVKGKGRVEFTIQRWLRRGELPKKIIMRYPEFSGKASFDIDARRIEQTLGWNVKYWSQPVCITAFVTDKNTGEEFNASKCIDLQPVRIKVETVAKPDHIKPGLPYVAYLKISEQDGSLLSAEDLETLVMQIQITYSYPYHQRKTKIETKDVVVGADGIIIFKIIADADKFSSVNFQVKIPSYPDKNQYWASWNAERFKSPSGTYIQVSTDDTSLSVGDMAKLTLYTTEKSDEYRIMMMARGKVIKQALYKPTMYEDSETYSKFSYQFTVEAEMSPSVYVVVSFIRDDGEIIADTVKINVQAALLNKVVMTTSTDKTDAGMPVSITVQAEAGSFVGLRAIDKSVLLLRSGNDITQTKVFQDLEKYGPSSSSGGFGGRWGGWWWPWAVGGADVSEVFENSGFIVLSDALVYKSKIDYYSCRRCLWAGRVVGGRADGGNIRRRKPAPSTGPKRKPESGQKDAVETRSFFPETWIWSEGNSGADGTTTFTYDTPDTITTWELSSFAVSDIKGLGVTKQNSQITVFRNFFISLNLPPTMIRGEVLNMKTTLFNYFDDDLPATLTLVENEWYELLIPPGADAVAAGPMRTVTIPAKDSVTVVFPIKFKKAGKARISVIAQSSLARDAVERTMVVKPEGIEQVVSHSSIIDRENVDDMPSVVTFDVDIPDDAVEDSVRVKFSVSGNLLGSALSNLGNLLKMPSGCGEQTMLSFAPDVYVSLYLQRVGELTGEIKQKSESHIREGYQNELRYQRRDGSFSAFGSSDRSGSTWLTAFVAKCFIAAQQLNADLIEDSKIERAVKFIMDQQQKDGTFSEPGRVIHTEMQGGVNSAETTAAYMLIALTEGGKFKKDEDVMAVVKRTQEYVEGRIDSVRDLYTLSIMAYALSLVESVETPKILKIIDQQATMKANVKYWEKVSSGASKCDEEENYCPYEDKPSSSSIEITSYVLLTYIKMGRSSEVMPIVRWLVQQRGAFGGYHSTQDTVMAIQALATVAGLFSDRTLDLDLIVTHDGKIDFGENFELSDENAIVLQMAMLPSRSGTVTVSATGQGFADVQVTVFYNIPVGPRSDEPFVVTIDVKERRMESTVEICTRINEKRRVVVNGTGMFVITFTLPSGYTINDKRATRENPQLKMVELKDEEVTGYFDELVKGKTICMKLRLERYAEVSGTKPKLVKAFDYYNPAFEARRLLSVGKKETFCDLCGSECVGCPDNRILPPPPPQAGYCVVPEDQCPCPDFVDGLYYDSGSQLMRMMAKYWEDSTCKAPQGAGDSSMNNGLPASLLDGTKQYIECSGTPYFNSILENGDGYTISIMVYPTELDTRIYYTVFSIGAEGAQKPYVIFAKRPRLQQYWFKIRMNDKQVIVRSIYTYEIPMNKWSMITTRVTEDFKASVFVNGLKTGKTVYRKDKAELITGEVTLKVGRSHIGGRTARGNWKGLVSNLDIWSRPLTDDQIMAHYKAYESVMVAEDPNLTQPMVHHVVSEAIRHCFEGSYTASQLKSHVGGNLRTLCDAPNGPKIPPPPVMLPEI